MQNLTETYELFLMHSWKFDDRQFIKVCDSLNAHDKNEFFIDMRKMDLMNEGKHYVYGLAKYYMQEDIPAIDSGMRQIV
jgi:hypothetical protein